MMPWTRWAHRDAVLLIDETGLLNRGEASCSVAQQYAGSTGKLTNCQIGCSRPIFPSTATP